MNALRVKKTTRARKSPSRPPRMDAPAHQPAIRAVKPARLQRDEVIELALERYAGYQSGGTLTPIPDLVERFEARGHMLTPHSISRYIMRAFKKGWVEVTAAAPNRDRPLDRRWKHDSALAAELVEAFKKHGLQKAVVITGIAPAGPGAFVDDPFYQALGEAMAERIAKEAFIRPKDRVGVGSGRAVYNTIKALGKYAPLNIQEPTLVSLSGYAWSSPDRRPRSVDADFNVTLFRECCQSAAPMYISYPLTASNSREETWLDKQKWKTVSCPHVALTGVGCLQKNHRFWVESPDDKSLDTLLVPIRGELWNLVDLVRDTVRENYSPVADIANHLFFVPHPEKTVAKEAEIRDAIDKMNGRLLNVSDEQFEEIPSIALIAGAKSKVLAIRELIVNPSYNVTFLCTDSATADELLGFEKQYPSKVRSTGS